MTEKYWEVPHNQLALQIEKLSKIYNDKFNSLRKEKRAPQTEFCKLVTSLLDLEWKPLTDDVKHDVPIFFAVLSFAFFLAFFLAVARSYSQRKLLSTCMRRL